MTTGPAEADLNPRRWGELASLLSMDVVRPFYELLGLELLAHDRTQQVLRREVVAARKRWEVALHLGPPITAPRLLQVVADSLGPEASRYLAWWNRNVFFWDPRDNLPLQSWSTVLQECRNEPDQWKRLFPDSIRDQALERLRRARNLDQYQLVQAEVDRRPLTDWDLHIYALRLYDDNLVEGQQLAVPDGPRLYVKSTIRAYQAYEFWAWVLKSLRSEQRERLWQEGRRIVDEQKLRLTSDLVHPSQLEILP